MTLGSHPHFSESITMFWIWHHTNEHNVVGINLDNRGRFHHHHHHDDDDGPDIINMDDMAFLWRSTESLWHFFIGPLDNLLWHGLSVARYDSQWKFSGGEGNISFTRSSAYISSPEEMSPNYKYFAFTNFYYVWTMPMSDQCTLVHILETLLNVCLPRQWLREDSKSPKSSKSHFILSSFFDLCGLTIPSAASPWTQIQGIGRVQDWHIFRSVWGCRI